jgi:hypothetical protein
MFLLRAAIFRLTHHDAIEANLHDRLCSDHAISRNVVDQDGGDPAREKQRQKGIETHTNHGFVLLRKMNIARGTPHPEQNVRTKFWQISSFRKR